jgi:hypothetical protein
MKYSTLEKAIFKVTSKSTNPNFLTLDQFCSLIDAFQSGVKTEDLKIDEIEKQLNDAEIQDKGKNSNLKTSKVAVLIVCMSN